jgi:hypothetical protein
MPTVTRSETPTAYCLPLFIAATTYRSSRSVTLSADDPRLKSVRSRSGNDEAESGERCTFTTRKAIRDSKLVETTETYFVFTSI